MSGERVEFARCTNITISLGGRELAHPDMAVFDLGSLLPTDWKELAGLVSLKTFAQQPITLDLANARLILESPESLRLRVAGMTPLRTRTATGQDGSALTMFFYMRQPAPGWYLFDSANLDVVRVSSHLGVPADSGDVGEGAVQLEGLPPIAGRWRIVEMIYDGALSEEFLRAWVITLDLAAGQAWAAQAASREAA